MLEVQPASTEIRQILQDGSSTLSHLMAQSPLVQLQSPALLPQAPAPGWETGHLAENKPLLWTSTTILTPPSVTGTT